MVPERHAYGNQQGAGKPQLVENDASHIFLEASRIAIHVRPRSPNYSPAKYVPVDWSQRLDISPELDVVNRPLLHLEVAEPRQRGPSQRLHSAVDKPPPRATIDIYHRLTRTAPRSKAPPPDADATNISLTRLPPAPCVRTTPPVTAPAAPEQPVGFGPRNTTLTNKPHTHHTNTAPLQPTQPPATNANTVTHITRGAPQSTSSAAARTEARPAAPTAPTQAFPQSASVHPPATVPNTGAALLAELMPPILADYYHPKTLPYAPPAIASGPHAASSGASGSAAQQQSTARPGGDPPMATRSPPEAPVWSSWGDYPSGLGAGLHGVTSPDADEEARLARRRHRKRVARIVVEHWKRFAGGRLRALAARKHHQRRLLTAALVAWRGEVVAGRARMRLAAVHDLKRAYLGLGRCVKEWSAAAKRRVRLRDLEEQGTIMRLFRQSRACLRAWRTLCYAAAEKRRQRLQAWYYWCFAVLTRVLRKWYNWVRSLQAKARRGAWATAQHHAALGRKVFKAWRRRRAYLSWKKAAIAKAGVFRRKWGLREGLRRWRAAAAACAFAQAAAAAALEAAAGKWEASRAAAAFGEWQAYAAARRHRRQRGRYVLAYMRRWRQLVCMWAWRQQVARQKHLQRCHIRLVKVAQHVRLGLAWSRWVLAVEVLQGQRTTELRAVVLVRATWAAWRAVVEHRAVKRELLAVATRRVGRVVAAAALTAWRGRVEHWQRKGRAWRAAVTVHRRRVLTRLVRGWRQEAVRLVIKGMAVRAAQAHRRQVLLARAVRIWRRYAWRQVIKHMATDRHPTRVLRCALLGWLRHTRYKTSKERNRRRAVRHRYLTLLHVGLRAFKAGLERRRAKEADWDDLARLHALHVARAALTAWRWQYLPAAAAKRASLRVADMKRRRWLLRCSLAGWVTQAARLAAKHFREREASGYAALRLLRRLLRRWSHAPELFEARRAAKAERLAELRAALAAAAASRLLAAWREVQSDLVMKRFQDTRARGAWRGRTLRRAMTCWAHILVQRRVSRLLAARAHAWRHRRLSGAALRALALYAGHRRATRRLQAVAWEHRRSSLARRTLAVLAWYARYRAGKAASYAAARMTHTRWLQREGAALWLQVGLARRQQRIEALVAAQARSLAQQLARVEPFARRWLHTVRSRRRQRLLAAVGVAGGMLNQPTYTGTGGPHGTLPQPWTGLSLSPGTWGGVTGRLGGSGLPAAGAVLGLAAAAGTPAGVVGRLGGVEASGVYDGMGIRSGWEHTLGTGYAVAHNPPLLHAPVRVAQGLGAQGLFVTAASSRHVSNTVAKNVMSGSALMTGAVDAASRAAPSRRPPPRTPPSLHAATSWSPPRPDLPTGPSVTPRELGAPSEASATYATGPVFLTAPTGAFTHAGASAASGGVAAAATVISRGTAEGRMTGPMAGSRPGPSSSRASRPQPRCPEFLFHPRPATVDEHGRSAGPNTVPRPASSQLPVSNLEGKAYGAGAHAAPQTPTVQGMLGATGHDELQMAGVNKHDTASRAAARAGELMYGSGMAAPTAAVASLHNNTDQRYLPPMTYNSINRMLSSRGSSGVEGRARTGLVISNTGSGYDAGIALARAAPQPSQAPVPTPAPLYFANLLPGQQATHHSPTARDAASMNSGAVLVPSTLHAPPSGRHHPTKSSVLPTPHPALVVSSAATSSVNRAGYEAASAHNSGGYGNKFDAGGSAGINPCGDEGAEEEGVEGTDEGARVAFSDGITIHRSGPQAPDVLRLPTRGGVEGDVSSRDPSDDEEGRTPPHKEINSAKDISAKSVSARGVSNRVLSGRSDVAPHIEAHAAWASQGDSQHALQNEDDGRWVARHDTTGEGQYPGAAGAEYRVGGGQGESQYGVVQVSEAAGAGWVPVPWSRHPAVQHSQPQRKQQQEQQQRQQQQPGVEKNWREGAWQTSEGSASRQAWEARAVVGGDGDARNLRQSTSPEHDTQQQQHHHHHHQKQQLMMPQEFKGQVQQFVPGFSTSDVQERLFRPSVEEGSQSIGLLAEQRPQSDQVLAPAIVHAAEQELAKLESVLLHCKYLKSLLRRLEEGCGHVEGMDPAGGQQSVGGQQGQVEEVRAALVALRPTVEYAATRLRQMRALGLT